MALAAKHRQSQHGHLSPLDGDRGARQPDRAALSGIAPVGFGPQDPPIGLQLIGRRGADLRLFQIGPGRDQAAPSTGTRPPEA